MINGSPRRRISSAGVGGSTWTDRGSGVPSSVRSRVSFALSSTSSMTPSEGTQETNRGPSVARWRARKWAKKSEVGRSTGGGDSSMPASTSRMAASWSSDGRTARFSPYREKRTGSNGFSVTAVVGTPARARLRTAPRPMTSELSTTARRSNRMACPSRELDRHHLAGHAPVAVPCAPGDAPGDRAARVPASHHEPTDGTEAAGGWCAEKVEPRDGGLEPGLEVGIAVPDPQGGLERGAEERVAAHVHPVPGTEEQVVSPALGPGVQDEVNPRAGRDRRDHRPAGAERDVGQARAEPRGSGRSDGGGREQEIGRAS